MEANKQKVLPNKVESLETHNDGSQEDKNYCSKKLFLTILLYTIVAIIVFAILGIIISYAQSNIEEEPSLDEASSDIIESKSNCSANSFLIGDGVCDEVTNNEQCLFDKGDCCLDDDESKKYCTSCQCNMAVNTKLIETQMEILSVKSFYLEESVELLTESYITNVARIEACTMFCLMSSYKAWTWNSEERICSCVGLAERFQCKSYFVQPLLDFDDDANSNTTIFIKTAQLALRQDCTERLAVIGGKSSTGHKLRSNVLTVEGNMGSACSELTTLDTVPKYGATGGLLASGDIIVCGGMYGNFSDKDKLHPESFECTLYMTSVGTKKTIQMYKGRVNSASIVMETTLFITGGKLLSGDSTIDMYQNEVSTEFISAEELLGDGPNLPTIKGMVSHCFVSLNATTAFLAQLQEVYYYDKHLMTWKFISNHFLFTITPGWLNPEVENESHKYQCSTMVSSNAKSTADIWVVITGLVFNDDSIYARTHKGTYIWSSLTESWFTGPNLPRRVCCGSLVSGWYHRSLFLVGGRFNVMNGDDGLLTTIYKFRCWSSSIGDCHWQLLDQELEAPREEFVALMVPSDMIDCEDEVSGLEKCFHENRMLIHDGICDDIANTHDCLFDGGDCCRPEIIAYFCGRCICQDDSEQHPVIITTGMEDLITVSKSRWTLNTEECAYDGNDCCAEDGVKFIYCSDCICHLDYP